MQEDEQFVLDLDDTLIACEKQDAKRSYTSKVGLLATVAYLSGKHDKGTGLFAHSRLRTGNSAPRGNQVSFLAGCLKQLGERKVYCLRADSASYQFGVIDKCRKESIHFVIWARLDVAISAKTDDLPKHQ